MSVIDRKTNSLESELHARDLVGGGDEELRILGCIVLAVRRNFWIVAFIALIAAAGAYIAASLVEDRFTASAQVKLNTRVEPNVQFTLGGPDLPINLASLESELEVMRSTDLIEASIFELDLIERPMDTENPETMAQFEQELEQLITTIRDNRVIEQIGTNSAVFEISVTNTDPTLAARLANSLAGQYLDRQTLDKVRTLERSQGWLAERSEQVQSQVTDLLQQQETFVIESPFSPEEAATITAQRRTGQRRLSALYSDLNALDDRISRIEALNMDGQFQTAAELLASQGPQLTENLAQFAANPTSGQQQAINTEISEGAAQLVEERSALHASISDTESLLADLRAKQELQAIHDGQVRQIEHEIAVAQAIYQDFVSELSRRTEQTDFLDSDGRIIEYARPPRTASAPNETLLSVAAFVVVMCLGIIAVMFSEVGNRKLRTTREYEDACGTDLRGVFPHLGPNKGMLSGTLDGLASVKFPALYTAARKLRLSVLATQDRSRRSLGADDQINPYSESEPAAIGQEPYLLRRRAHVLAGASAVAGEGQSTSLLALAQAFAESGESVVLVDGDFWNSPYRDRLDRPTSGGSVNWGTDGRLFDSGIQGLQILPARLENPSAELRRDISAFLNSNECEKVFADLANRFDRIIIDAPTVLEVMDSVTLLSLADQVIFFSRWKATDKAMVLSAMRVLDDVSIRPVFCVATLVRLQQVARYGDPTLSYFNRGAKLAL